MNRSMLAVATTAAVAALGVLALPAHAEERSCRGTIGKVTVDNLRVPQGATCTLNGTLVKGTIEVEGDATLRATAIRVIGNIQAENHRHVSVAGGSRVDGSLQVKQAAARRSTARSSAPTCSSSPMPAQISITGNRIDGNLQCKENRPAPTGGANIVQGIKEDQCARLSPDAPSWRDLQRGGALAPPRSVVGARDPSCRIDGPCGSSSASSSSSSSAGGGAGAAGGATSTGGTGGGGDDPNM